MYVVCFFTIQPLADKTIHTNIRNCSLTLQEMIYTKG